MYTFTYECESVIVDNDKFANALLIIDNNAEDRTRRKLWIGVRRPGQGQVQQDNQDHHLKWNFNFDNAATLERLAKFLVVDITENFQNFELRLFESDLFVQGKMSFNPNPLDENSELTEQEECKLMFPVYSWIDYQILMVSFRFGDRMTNENPVIHDSLFRGL